MTTRAIIEEIMAMWCVQDVERTVDCMSEDAVYQLYISENALPYGGQTRGREAIRDMFYTMLTDWNYLNTTVTSLTTEGSTGRAQVTFRYHHIKTGGVIDGSLRFVFEVKDGFVTRIDEYHDQAKFEAFLKFAESYA